MNATPGPDPERMWPAQCGAHRAAPGHRQPGCLSNATEVFWFGFIATVRCRTSPGAEQLPTTMAVSIRVGMAPPPAFQLRTARPRNCREFTVWNEQMVQRFDPDTYHTRSALPIRVIERLRVRAIRRLLAAAPSSRVLEVGVGGGNVLQHIAAVQFGIDLSPFILRKAHARLDAAAGLVRGDAMALPFRDGSFDRVYCSEVLEHVLDPEEAVREMHRVLAPGGIAVVSVPNEALINRLKELVFGLPFGRRLLTAGAGEYQVSEKMDDEWHLHAFGRGRLEQALAGRFAIERLVGVPSRLVPLRLVARLQRTKLRGDFSPQAA
jgi:ubiquinone/menaquinone biosynthesis C-methylase UbiE